jgi:hypothetical protein
MTTTRDEQLTVERSVLRQYGLRYAILAAWSDELRSQKIKVVPDPVKTLEGARVKISSGCFSVCEVGCDLSRIEGILVSTASSAGSDTVDSWLDLLADSMSSRPVEEIERRIQLPAIKTYFNKFGFGPCRCDS